MKTSSPIIFTQFFVCFIAVLSYAENDQYRSSQDLSHTAGNHALGVAVNDREKRRILEEFSQAFNSNNHSALYSMLGEPVRVISSREAAKLSLQKLKREYGEIVGGKFSYYYPFLKSESHSIYMLYYDIQVVKDAAQPEVPALLEITVVVVGNTYKIYGLNIEPR